LFINIWLFKDGVLFVRLYKTTGYYLSACANLWGTVCPRVQIDGVLCVRLCKSTGYYLSACAKMTGNYLSGVLFVRNPPGRASAGDIIYRRRPPPVRYVTTQEKFLKNRPMPGRLSNLPVMCKSLKSYVVSFICDHSIICVPIFTMQTSV